MKTIILKNTTNSNITIETLGLTILKKEDVNIDFHDLIRFSSNEELLSLVNVGSIIVNNGSKDLNISEAKIHLQPISENIFSISAHTHTKNEITDFDHNHNDKYYTKTESDNIFTDKNYISSNYSEINHSHDDRYYTESEIDQMITASTFGIVGAVDFFEDLPSSESTNSIYIVRQTKNSNQEGFYRWNESSWEFLANNTGTSVHNQMLGLNDGDFKHLTLSEYSNITSGNNTSLHKHDDRYYTESEIDSLLENKSNISHSHDDRHYTKTQLQSSNQSQVNWNNLTSVPATFTPSNHLHDDRYYTESEINTKLSQINFSFVSANDSTTDVTGAELERLTNGSNADGLHTHSGSGGTGSATLNSAYGSWGAGRIIDVVWGSVQLNGKDGFAPLKLTPVTYTPNQWLGGGELVVKNNTLFLFDTPRGKFLSVGLINPQWSSNSYNAGGYIDYGSAQTNSKTGFIAPWDGTIVAITGAIQNKPNNATFDLEVNGNTKQSFWWNNGYVNINNLNIDISSGDVVNIKLTSYLLLGPDKPCITLFIRERI